MGWNLIQYITKEYRYQFNGNTVHTISATGISMVLTSHIATNKFAHPELGGSSKKKKTTLVEPKLKILTSQRAQSKKILRSHWSE